jgi:enhancing lycopene biosynthesis protein 2
MSSERKGVSMATVGVLLSGAGVFDGSEIHEATSILIALDRRGAKAVCMAPNIPQAGVVNHATKQPDPASRSVFEEAARIARGNIKDLATVNAADLDALIFPGGFGAVKNLCNFAAAGTDCTVNPQVKRLIEEMHNAKKPIGLACIAPILAAKVLSQFNPQLTIGTDAGTADAIHSMGGRHVNTDPTGVCIDETNRLVTTPCYMNEVGPWTVYQGAEKMVDEVLRMAKAN